MKDPRFIGTATPICLFLVYPATRWVISPSAASYAPFRWPENWRNQVESPLTGHRSGSPVVGGLARDLPVSMVSGLDSCFAMRDGPA